MRRQLYIACSWEVVEIDCCSTSWRVMQRVLQFSELWPHVRNVVLVDTVGTAVEAMNLY